MYIFVCTQYRHVCSASQAHFTFHQARSAGALRRQRVSAPRRLLSCRAASFLSSVSSHDRPPRRGLSRPNCHSHGFTSYTLLPRLPSAAAVSQLPAGKPEPLCWLYLWGMVGVKLPARNKGSVELCPPCRQLEPHKGMVLVRAHTIWSHQHAPLAHRWAVSAPQRC